MSRCFPFPPPGYEPKPSTGLIDVLTKEKRREKKHRKEKRENKEKRPRSKDKHKERKDQKHKDRKKGNDGDKGRTSEDVKAEGRAQVHNESHIKESWQKAEENKYSKFQELDRRTGDGGTKNQIFENFPNSIQRKFEGMGAASASLEKERVAASRNKMHGCISSATALEKERNKMQEKAAISRGAEESRNHGISRPTESVSGSAVRRTEAGTENKKCGERSLVSNPVTPGFERGKLGAKILPLSSIAAAQRRKDVSRMPVENLASIRRKTEVASIPSLYSGINGMDSVPAMEKERAGHNKLRNSGKKNQIDALNSKPLAPHKDNAVGIARADGTLKKRKCLDTNGYLRENDERPEKKPRMASSSQSLLNGRPLEPHLYAPSGLHLQSGAMNHSRPGRLSENKEREMTKKSGVSLVFLPHPDSRYLSQIYSVPKMAELAEIDDREWLFGCHEKSKIELKAEKTQAMRIDSADILALPYVVPF